MGLLGLFEPVDPAPGDAGGVGHDDVATGEDQAECRRGELEPRVSTRRPILAAAANVGQLTRDVATQGGQVEVITCIGCGRKGLRYRPVLASVCCTPISAVDSGVAVVIIYVCLLLKPHTTFI